VDTAVGCMPIACVPALYLLADIEIYGINKPVING
jgi:hypothetical protein